MPERYEIYRSLKLLPIIPVNQDYLLKDGEVWEKNEYGAHFKVIRVQIPEIKPPNNIAYCLSLSGQALGINIIINEFINSLGLPTYPLQYAVKTDMIMVAWRAVDAALFINNQSGDLLN